MYNSTRITAILNCRQELPRVLKNLEKVFSANDKVLLVTKSEKSEVYSSIKEFLSVDDKWVDENVTYDRFNEVKYDEISKVVDSKRIFCIKAPNSLYHTISTAYNDVLKFVDSTKVARFVHFFADDCKIVSDSYDPTAYEWFMETFSEPFVMDSKLNSGNYAFKKYSPRFVFMSKTYLRQPISFVQYETKDHFVVDVENFKYRFDEKVKRLYIPELVHRLHKDGVIKHTSFYPDPVLEQWVKRDETLPFSKNIEEIVKDYSNDEKYLKETLKVAIAVENAVDPIINEVVAVIKSKLEKQVDEEAPRIVIPKIADENAREAAK